MRYQEPLYTNWAKGDVLLQKVDQKLFELVRRFQNIDVIKKNLIGAARDIVESRIYRKQRPAFSENKIGHL